MSVFSWRTAASAAGALVLSGSSIMAQSPREGEGALGAKMVETGEMSISWKLRASIGGERGIAIGEFTPGWQGRSAPVSSVVALQFGSVVGRVTDARTGAAVEAATVAVEGTRLGATTGADGRYRISDLPAGAHTITARRLGYTKAMQQVVIVAEQESTLDFTIEPSAGALDQVIVTGTVAPTEVKALPTPTTVITAADIELRDPRRLDQLLRELVPSTVAWDPGSTADQQTISMRGASSLTGQSRVKIYVDGIETSQSSFTIIDPQSIERLEVVRGPQAATLYGSDAIGGVIQVFTKKGWMQGQRPQADVKLSAGMLESPFKRGGTLRQDYGLSLHGGGPAFSYNVGGSYARTGDWLPEYYLSAPSAYAGLHLAQDRLTIDASGRYFTTKQGVPKRPELVRRGISSPVPNYEDTEFRQETYGARVGYAAASWWQHSLTLGIDHFSFDDHNTRSRLTTPADTFLFVYLGNNRKASLGYSSYATVRVIPAVVTTITAGLDRYTLTTNTFYTFGAANLTGPINTNPASPTQGSRDVITNSGYFAQMQIGIRDELFFTGGARAESNSSFGASVKTPISPRIGLSYARELRRTQLKLRASYGEAIRPPDANQKQYSRNPYVILAANPNLGPERQAGFDVGLDLAWKNRGSFSITYYDQTARELIQRVIIDSETAPPTSQFQNVGRVANSGIELDGALRIGSVSLNGQYALTNSRVRQLALGYSGDLKVGDDILGIPHVTAAARITLLPIHGLTISAGVTYTGRQTYYDDIALMSESRPSLRDYWTTYPSFAKANVALTQRLTQNISVFATVENIGNSHPVEQTNIAPVQGRTTMIGARIHQ